MNVPLAMRRAVDRRAGGRCEYCGLSQKGQEARFHADHILLQSQHGLTELENLALACVSCSLRKGARQAVPDPATGKLTVLFNPRIQVWKEHFRWEGCRVIGLTATGRATVEALKMNRALAVAIRREEAGIGRHPPPAH